MNARQELFNELRTYAVNVRDETGWSPEKAWYHVLDHHGHKLRAVAADEVREQQRRELEYPQEAFMRAAAREHERNPKEPRVRIYSRLFKNNPAVAPSYDRKIKGGNPTVQNTSGEIAEKARIYAREKNVDVAKAAREVMAENPDLAHRWHFGRAAEKSPQRKYQDEEPEIEPAVGNAFQRLGSVVVPLIGTGEMAAALRFANENPRLSQQAASEWLARRGQQWAERHGLLHLRSAVNPQGQSAVLRDNPAVRRMVNNGTTSAEALLALYLPKARVAA